MKVKTMAVLATVTLLAGCPAYFVSTYDATTDKAVTALQRDIERHLSKLEALAAEPPGLESLVEACRPEHFQETYLALQTDVRALVLRNEARDKNKLTVEQLKLLQSNLDTLREQQQERYAPTGPDRTIVRPGDHCMIKDQIEGNRQLLEQNIRAILTLELAKREFRQEE